MALRRSIGWKQTGRYVANRALPMRERRSTCVRRPSAVVHRSYREALFGSRASAGSQVPRRRDVGRELRTRYLSPR
jgi:hypothetical protein